MTTATDTEVGLTQRVRLPYGLTVTFRWSPSSTIAEWSPHMPQIQDPHHRRRLFAAYDVARNAFFSEVASIIGGTVLVADLGGRIAVIKPATRH